MKKTLAFLLAIAILFGQNTHVFAENTSYNSEKTELIGLENEVLNTLDDSSGVLMDNSLDEVNSSASSSGENQKEKVTSDNKNEVIIVDDIVYENHASATSNGVTLNVEWNNPILGQNTTFHVSAIGGSDTYMFRMDAPSYSNPDEWAFESVADPSRGEWVNYTSSCSSYDYNFTMMASGTYNFRFYVMDKTAGVYYLRVSTNVQVADDNYPSVSNIVNSAVSQCMNETDGSDYQKALWLHDWLLNQLDYDNSLKWSSSESALTRKLGTCQAYESAYSKLLTAAGIENSETRDTYDGHTWNAMKLDGNWYQVDCTWDDSNDNWYNFDQRHLYFGLTDELMALAHQGHSKIYSADGYATRSTHLEDNFFVKNGDAAKWAEAYRDRIQSYLNENNTEFVIEADNASYPPSISGIQNGIITYAIMQNDWDTENQNVELQLTGDATKFTFTALYSEKFPKEDDIKSELDKLAADNIDAVKDGIYTIKSAVDNRYVLDVYWGLKTDEANVQLYAANGTDAQKWKVTHDEAGYITITNMGSYKVLEIEGGAANNEANIQQYSPDSQRAQKWIAIKESDGSVQIVSALDPNKCMDLYWGQAKNLSNVQLYESNGTKAQRWIFTKESKADELAEKHKDDIKDGIYTIKSAVDNRYVLDVYWGLKTDEANVQLYAANGTDAQKWKVTHDEAGYITITNMGSNKVLEIEGGAANNEANIQQYSSDSQRAQKWIAIKESDGGVQIVSALDPNKCMDLYWGQAKNLSNVQLYESNGTKAQKWYFIKVSK